MNDVVPASPRKVARVSHEYIWDMICWYGDHDHAAEEDERSDKRALFSHELSSIDQALNHVTKYFKAASAGADDGRSLLLLLGPPSGG